MDELGRDLSRREASDAVTGLGWRYVLGVLRANLRVGSLAEAAGGALRSDAEAPAFWVLADPEGNEACVTTWQGRDP
jgi:hypothetical protein